MRRGTRVGEAYVALSADGTGMNDDIVDSVDEAGPGIEAKGREHGQDYSDEFGRSLEERLEPMMERLGQALGERLSKRVSNSLRGSFTSTAQNSILNRLGDALSDRVEDAFAGVEDRIAGAVRSAGGRGSSGGGGSPPPAPPGSGNGSGGDNEAFIRAFERMIKALELRVPIEKTTNRDTGSNIGDMVGRMLGAGSRSNLLNFFGKSLGNIVGLVDKARTGAGAMFSAFTKGFSQMGEGATLLQKVGGGFSGVASSVAGLASTGPGGLIALAIAIGTVTVGMGVLVTVAGALLAVATALASTIASALVGALLVAAPALAAVVVGAGLLTAAFTSMTTAQKEALSADFAPLKAELTGIGQLMITQMIPYFSTWSGNLQRAFYLITPLAARMGDAFGRAGNIITSSLGGAGFQKLFAALATYLPNITVQLSLALGRFLNGLAGTFGALMPLVNRFANYLADAAQRFSEFANSAEGQNAIVDFAERAVDSLMSLWDFLGQVGGLISDVLFSATAQTAGNTLFDDLADAVQGFRNTIADGRLEQWFEDGIKLAESLGKMFTFLGQVMEWLYSSKIIDGIAAGFSFVAFMMRGIEASAKGVQDFFSSIGSAVSNAIGPLDQVAGALGRVLGLFDAVTGAQRNLSGSPFAGVSTSGAAQLPLGSYQGPGINPTTGKSMPITPTMPDFSLPTLPELKATGTRALNRTYESAGGNVPDPKTSASTKAKKYKNPYTDLANSLIQQAPTVAEEMRAALKEMNRQVVDAVRSSTRGDLASVRSSLNSVADSVVNTANSAVESAQAALSSKAQTLAGATSKKAAKAALRDVRRSQRELQAAFDQQARVNRAVSIIDAQKIVNQDNVNRLVNGLGVQNATLADYAEARARVTARLEEANSQLAAAVQLRDGYYDEVASGVKSFTSLMTAQAQTLDGVTQALTATDIIENLRTRLLDVVKFQDNMRILLARGLSNAAYQQLVSAGVESGGAYAEALVNGGAAAIGELNSLVGLSEQAAASLGYEASNRLYQAGVDAAQGLVDGLNSMSAQLDSAATRLGETIAQAVRNALGIASPSKVMFGITNNVGDTAVMGLRAQYPKVGLAAEGLGEAMIPPNEAAARLAASVPYTVSGNPDTDTRFRDLIVHTPTEDPEAVAKEVLNEVTGRIG